MKPLLLNKKVALTFAIIGLVLLVIGAFLKITHWSFNGIAAGTLLLPIGVILHGIAWFVVLYDLIVNPIRNKVLWFLGMIFMHNITVILYLINREKHLPRKV